MELLLKAKDKLATLIIERDLSKEPIKVRAKPLTPSEAIGNPERNDFPILKGKERLMQAEFMGALGQAFSDMYGNFEGTISEVLEMELSNNYQRSIFVASLNAIMRYASLVEGTIHCRDNQPGDCSKCLVEFVSKNYRNPKIALVGLQPAMAECLTENYDIRITDMCPDNIGKQKFNHIIQDGSKYNDKVLNWCDLALVTGTTAVGGTIDAILSHASGKETVFYGVTVAGIAELMGFKRFCPYST